MEATPGSLDTGKNNCKCLHTHAEQAEYQGTKGSRGVIIMRNDEEDS